MLIPTLRFDFSALRNIQWDSSNLAGIGWQQQAGKHTPAPILALLPGALQECYCLLRGGGGFLAGFHSGGCFAATLGLWRSGWRFADEFRDKDAGDEQLWPMIVKIDGGAFWIRRSDDPQAVLLMLDGLPFLHYLHFFLLGPLGEFRISFSISKRRGSRPLGSLSPSTG